MELTAKLFQALQKAVKMVDFENKSLRFQHWLCLQVTTVSKKGIRFSSIVSNKTGFTVVSKSPAYLRTPHKSPHWGF